jgi:hypothetical protein
MNKLLCISLSQLQQGSSTDFDLNLLKLTSLGNRASPPPRCDGGCFILTGTHFCFLLVTPPVDSPQPHSMLGRDYILASGMWMDTTLTLAPKSVC